MLARPHRLRHERDIRHVLRFGKPLRTPSLTLKHARHPSAQRFAFVVSTKVAKKATVRNRLKRQLRALVRQQQALFPSGRDYLFIVNRPRGAQHTRDTLLRDFTTLLRHLH